MAYEQMIGPTRKIPLISFSNGRGRLEQDRTCWFMLLMQRLTTWKHDLSRQCTGTCFGDLDDYAAYLLSLSSIISFDDA